MSGVVILCIHCLGANCNPPPPIDSSIKVNVPPLNLQAVRPRVDITQVYSDNNIEVLGRRGILLHVRAYFDRLENLECIVSVYFFDEWGRPLWDSNGVYRATDGQVAFAQRVRTLLPTRAPVEVSLFMPYDELHVQPGTKVLCRIRIYDSGGRITADQTGFYSFTVPRL